MSSAISLRIPPGQLRLIDQAANACGKSRTSFMIEAACSSATDILLDQSPDDQSFARSQEALDVPVADNATLRRVLETRAPWE
jgi:uncharacterized protein (DUF1778 family)